MLLLLSACDGYSVKFDDDTGDPADTDTDTDTDTDADTDTDTDSDTDTDTDTEVWPDRLPEDAATTLYADQDSDGTGTMLSLGAGDVTGDGVADLFIASPSHSTSSQEFTGRVWVASRPEAGSQELSTSYAWIDGTTTSGYLGSNVASAGDVNGDGEGDLVIGERITSNVFVFHGPLSPGAHDTSQADLVFGGEDVLLGSHVAPGGDVNGDGSEDLIVSCGDLDAVASRVYVALNTGESGTIDPGADAFVVAGTTARERAGAGDAFTGDLDGDGFLDLAIGAPYSGPDAAGAAAVYYGPLAVRDTSLDDADTWLDGAEANAYTGGALAFADLDADGYTDLAIGAPFAHRVYIHTGGDRPNTVALADVPQLRGDADHTGMELSPAGDLDGDGFEDLLIGASFRESGEGSAWVAYGPMSPGIDQLGLGEQRFLGNTEASLFGMTLVGNADIDGDGGPDVTIGGRYSDITDRGAIYLFSGR